jgi:hypothetical protein
MSTFQRLVLVIKAARQLGLEPVRLYAQYQLALRSGWLRRKTPPRAPADTTDGQKFEISPGLVKLPSRTEISNIIGDRASSLLAEANDLKLGRVRLFGGAPQDLDLVVPLPLHHWTSSDIGLNSVAFEDIKFLWEPARFSWVYTLARAFMLSGDETYVETFWQEYEAFADINIPNMGPNWVSAQEVAIRLISFVFAYQIFYSAEASTEVRIERLSGSIADHAARIPPTIAYARAQNNNHLLSESAGLITAGLALQSHPDAEKWVELGRRWFNHGLEKQISPHGTYAQHCTNYHRMMLQLALWISALGDFIDEDNTKRLEAAALWLLDLTDPDTGRVPNLGHNDGSLIQPLSSCAYADYRPVVQAAAMRYLGKRPLSGGPWDEYPLWLGYESRAVPEVSTREIQPDALVLKAVPDSHITLHDQSNSSWGSMRIARFDSRPAHADQLQLDLWWRDYNVALDPGNYLYNASPPWDNALATTAVHNTISVQGSDQMTRAGRFLWLDWAQAELVDKMVDPGGKWIKVSAKHDGYKLDKITHQRSITCKSSGGWLIEDQLHWPTQVKSIQITSEDISSTGELSQNQIKARLHWLLPDWSWEINDENSEQSITFKMRSPQGWIDLLIGIEPVTLLKNVPDEISIQLVRGGELIHGTGTPSPVSGWVSPTYGYKIPALSLAVEIETSLPVKFYTHWNFPQGE